jgi:hypothetical protein
MFQMDDYTNTPDVNTFWFGYVETYNINSGTNVPPISGYVCDYTMRRVVWTLKWAKRNFPVDPNRVYVTASSMGGICGVSLAMSQPDLIAAVMVSVPRFDFSQIADPNLPVCAFNEGESQRVTCDRLWGPVPEDLPLDTGVPVYTRLNAGAMARQLESRFVPPIIAFNGRNDVIVGWAEKIPFYTAMRESRAGGMFFWDTRDHAGTATSAWVPMQDYSYVYRFCINRSFPALTNCSADNNPGNGLASDGDSIGTINGFVEWDTSLVDRSDSWQVKLNTRSLTTRWGIVTAPESLTVDVTPRRLQTFSPVAGIDYQWTVTRRSDAAIVQMGVVRLDAMGVMTVPGVKVYPGGSVLVIGTGAYAVSGVDPRHPGGRAPMIAPFASPTRASMAITVTWAHDGDATVDLLDLAGRQVRRIDAGSVIAGPRTVRFDASGLSSGIYFVCARQAGTTDVRRLALLH